MIGTILKNARCEDLALELNEQQLKRLIFLLKDKMNRTQHVVDAHNLPEDKKESLVNQIERDLNLQEWLERFL